MGTPKRILLFKFLTVLQHMEFPGQGSDPRCSFDLSAMLDTEPGIKPATQLSQGTTDPIELQWELIVSSLYAVSAYERFHRNPLSSDKRGNLFLALYSVGIL